MSCKSFPLKSLRSQPFDWHGFLKNTMKFNLFSGCIKSIDHKENVSLVLIVVIQLTFSLRLVLAKDGGAVYQREITS